MIIHSDEHVKAAERFIDLVKRMRDAQREWFRLRDRMMLVHAKMMEQEVDQQLEEWGIERAREEAKAQHPELFPAE
jgi:hypothetical protein